MTDRPFVKDDKVIIKPEHAPAHLLGQVFIVERVKTTKVIARPPGGRGGIDYPKDYLEHFDGEIPASGRVAVTVPIPEFFETGAVVTASVLRGISADTPLVVFKDDGSSKVNVVKLGGAGANYWRVGRSALVKRDLAWLKEHI